MTHRTLAADLCPDWQWDGTAYRHLDPTTATGLGPGSIAFAPPESSHPPNHPREAHCTGCGARWRRSQGRWQKDEET